MLSKKTDVGGDGDVSLMDSHVLVGEFDPLEVWKRHPFSRLFVHAWKQPRDDFVDRFLNLRLVEHH